MIAFLLDEHIGRRLQRALRLHSAEIIVWRIGELGVPTRGTLDPAILAWCEANGFVLVTNNRSTMPVHLRDHLEAGRHVPGIFVPGRALMLDETAQTPMWPALCARASARASLTRAPNKSKSTA